MARYRDDGEVQIDNSTNGRFRIAFQWLIEIVAFNVGTLLSAHVDGVSSERNMKGVALQHFPGPLH
jgi:hypothetical protein